MKVEIAIPSRCYLRCAQELDHMYNFHSERNKYLISILAFNEK